MRSTRRTQDARSCWISSEYELWKENPREDYPRTHPCSLWYRECMSSWDRCTLTFHHPWVRWLYNIRFWFWCRSILSRPEYSTLRQYYPEVMSSRINISDRNTTWTLQFPDTQWDRSSPIRWYHHPCSSNQEWNTHNSTACTRTWSWCIRYTGGCISWDKHMNQ